MNQNNKRIGILVGFFLVSVTSSMDIWLNIPLGGFNVRFAVLVMMVMVSWFAIDRIHSFRLSLPAWMWYLLLIAVWNLGVSFWSFFPLRSLAYAVWFFVFVGWVIALFVWNQEDNELFPWMLFLFILSFLPALFVGWLQWAIPSLTLNEFFPWKTQGGLEVGRLLLQRANGWNYEPSYYATYLIVLPPLLWTWFRQTGNRVEKKVSLLFLFFSILIVILSTSRMGWVALLLFIITGITIEGIYWISKKKILTQPKSKIVVIVGGIFLAVGILSLLFNWNSVETLLKKLLRYSYSERMEGIRNVLEVIFRHPITGVSLGGIAPDIASSWLNTPPQNNSQVKPFEGTMVWLEIIAAWGGVGFFLLGGLIINLFQQWKNALKQASLSQKTWLIALTGGLGLQLFLLMFNQNLLRVYVWNTLAIFAAGVFWLGKTSSLVMPRWCLPPLSRYGRGVLLAILLSSIGILIFIAQPIVLQVYEGTIILEDGNKISQGIVWFHRRDFQGEFHGMQLTLANGKASFNLSEQQSNISETYFSSEEVKLLWIYYQECFQNHKPQTEYLMLVFSPSFQTNSPLLGTFEWRTSWGNILDSRIYTFSFLPSQKAHLFLEIYSLRRHLQLKKTRLFGFFLTGLLFFVGWFLGVGTLFLKGESS